MLKELQQMQEKIHAIDRLSNCIQKATVEDAKEIAYLIHRIVEAEYIDITLAREIMVYQLKTNKDLFIQV